MYRTTEDRAKVTANFLKNFDRWRDEGMTKKQMAKELGVTITTLNTLFKTHDKPPLLSKGELYAPKVRAHIEKNGGSINAACAWLGLKKNTATVVREIFRAEGFDYKRYAYTNCLLGCYIGGVISEEEMCKPWNTRRIPVECARCGAKHHILVSQFSAARQSQCSACPNQTRQYRLFLLVETQEYFSSLLQLHREYFASEVDYQMLRLKLLECGFYKSKDGKHSVTLVSKDDDRQARTHSGRGSRSKHRPSAASVEEVLEIEARHRDALLV